MISARPAALTVPGDEYLSCCGIRLDYFGDPGGRLIWTATGAPFERRGGDTVA